MSTIRDVARLADVSIAGIDDVSWSAVIGPRITTAVQPVAEMARMAIRLLMDRIAATEPISIQFKDVILAPHLVVGQSTRAVATV